MHPGLLVLVGLLAIPQAPNAPARITGRVVEAETGHPIRGAVVQLTGGQSQASPVRTDLDGRFVLTERRIGRYALQVSKPGYVASVFGRFADASDHFDVVAGQQIERGTIRLQVAAVISGRVQNESGEPIAEAIVTAWRTEFPQPGIRTWRPVKEAPTNDLGEFRLHGLMPGVYHIAASRMSQPPEVTTRTPDGRTADAVVLVQSITGQAGAMPQVSEPVIVETSRGGETSGNTLTLSRTKYVRVSGSVVDSSGRPPVAGDFVTLRPAQPDGLPVRRGANVLPDKGSFAFNNVPVGEYRLTASALGQRVGNASARSESAAMTLHVREDISGLVLQTQASEARPAVSGRVFVDGVPSAVRLQRLGAAGDVDPDGIILPATVPSRPDGQFVLGGGGGWFALRAAGSAPLGLKSVTAGGVDVTDGFDATRATGPLEVHLTTQVSNVSGVVKNANDAVVPAADVLIFPVDPASWKIPFSRRLVLLRTDARGAFDVTGLPSGQYLAAAPADLERSMWADPDRLERLRAIATPLSVVDGEVTKIDLKRK